MATAVLPAILNPVPFVDLSPRTQQVVRMLADESLPNKDIAARMGIGDRTVKQHIHNLALRLGISGPHPRCQVRVLIARHYRAPEEPTHQGPTLKPRHKEISRMVACGMSNKDIAKEISTTPQVVKNYLRDIFDVAGVWTRLELAQWYLNHFGNPEVIQ